MAKLHIINYQSDFICIYGRRVFRSLNKGWEFVFLSRVLISEVFHVPVGDFRCPPAPSISASAASGGTVVGRGGGGGDFALAAKAWHLALVICVPVAGHWAFLDLE